MLALRDYVQFLTLWVLFCSRYAKMEKRNSSNKKGKPEKLLYERHYKPWVVYLLPPFFKTIFF